ncbi:sterol 3-beta-glucosyltransferase isoform X3 [Nymphaea colorata]|uniref:sterol 3-beta-glucosyltransferase isoform X3 n=1 Tax=Nymphaea colorata TaxID=210225 RepID=UPI00129EDFC6|nr:sterol 3-beta-glucosyltransferase isoform X3 [Nymphaea colorata]
MQEEERGKRKRRRAPLGHDQDGRPRAVFMAFGTKGDVLPVAAIAAALARNLENYHVFLITHTTHEYLSMHMLAEKVSFVPISTPPVLSMQEHDDDDLSFSSRKVAIDERHKLECLSAVESVFEESSYLTGDFIAMNFFALAGILLNYFGFLVLLLHLMLFHTACLHHTRADLKMIFHFYLDASKMLRQASWKDVTHWMWPLFTENWGSWRSQCLRLSACPLTDPVTGLPMLHDWPQSPLLLYGFSREIVECPDYWPSSVHDCGLWFPPLKWEFSCTNCGQSAARFPSEESAMNLKLCMNHSALQNFLEEKSGTCSPIFIGLSSIGRMGFMRKPEAFLSVLKVVLENTDHRVILFSAGYEPLNNIIRRVHRESSKYEAKQKYLIEDGILLFDDKLFCFSGSIPYKWVFSRCSIAVHHGGSGSTAAALSTGIPQILCPFILDQFYWAERMSWLGVAPDPLSRSFLIPDEDDHISISQAANALIQAIRSALSDEIKTRASEVAQKISKEDGIGKALRILKESGICLAAK